VSILYFIGAGNVQEQNIYFFDMIYILISHFPPPLINNMKQRKKNLVLSVKISNATGQLSSKNNIRLRVVLRMNEFGLFQGSRRWCWFGGGLRLALLWVLGSVMPTCLMILREAENRDRDRQ
jgi:hypothetical protein